MAFLRFGKHVKRPPFGFRAKVLLVVFLGLSFIVIWSIFSSPSSSVTSQRSSFGDIEPELEKEQGRGSFLKSAAAASTSTANGKTVRPVKEKGLQGSGTRQGDGELPKENLEEKMPVESESKGGTEDGVKETRDLAAKNANARHKPQQELDEGEGGEEKEEKEMEEATDGEGRLDGDLEEGVDVDAIDEEVAVEERRNGKSRKNKKSKNLGPLFESRVHYIWSPCSARSGNRYIPCIDFESAAHRHRERSCPKTPVMCLVPLPQGYRSPVPWPERQSKVFYRNVAHPKLSAFIKTQSWLRLVGDYIMFPHNESRFIGGADHYLGFMDEMVPDIEWGKNIRILLDVGSTDASFAAALLEKEVLTLSLGVIDDQMDLAQLYMERGIPAVLGNLGTRRLPFPSGVFDTIHCGECNIPWHSNGGKLLLEMNRILRPGGYFVMSFKHGNIESEKAMSDLMANICWNTLAHTTDDDSELGIKIYQRPSSNDIYELRRKKYPPLCKEDDNQDAAWYTPMKTCLHTIPAAIEQRGTDWPEEWPSRLETFPEWLADSRERLIADTRHWKAIVNKSYLDGMGIDWSNIRNIMDMKAIYGGFAVALASQKVWVMNVVPVHAPNTLPVIFERGLLGVYHDWCEPFNVYPRSYDLLHADHLFSRLKNRCKQPIVIVVEMDRILRPGGWAIIRDKLEILNPLESILKSLHWDIKMTYGKDREGIICVQKTTWRP